jgi:ABC-2 type transport system ATP-binding protein
MSTILNQEQTQHQYQLSEKPVIEISQLYKSYKKIGILKSLDLTIKQGQIIGLVGRNGAGKTSLIETLMGLRQQDAGDIKIWQQALGDLSSQQKESIGFVPQDGIGFEWMKVGQYLKYFGGFFGNWDQDYSEQLISRWKLDNKSRIADLSGGQQQILQVIQALSIKPKLLILDEPVAHLDPNMRRQFLAELVELTCELDTTVLFSTHIISDLERVASHIALLNHGKIEHFYELEELKANAASLLFEKEVIDQNQFSNLINWQSINNGCKAILATPLGPNINAIEEQLGITIQSQPLSLEDWYLEVTHETNS